MYYIESDNLTSILRRNGAERDLYIQTGVRPFDTTVVKEETGYAFTEMQIYNVSEEEKIQNLRDAHNLKPIDSYSIQFQLKKQC